MDLVHCTT